MEVLELPEVPETLAVKLVRHAKFWISIGALLMLGGFLVGEYLSRYAQAADLVSLSKDQDDLSKRLSSHIEGEAARLGAVEALGKNVEEDYHQMATQVFEIAKAVGAREVPLPNHREKK